MSARVTTRSVWMANRMEVLPRRGHRCRAKSRLRRSYFDLKK